MRSPRHHANLQRLLDLSKAAAYADLAREAEHIAADAGRSQSERGAAFALWGYSLLRLDAHKYRHQATDLTTQAGNLQRAALDSGADLVDTVGLTIGLSWQLLNDHAKAVVAFDGILSRPAVDLRHKVKAAFARAFSMDMTGQHQEALGSFLALGEQLDALPADVLTYSLLRDRARIRINVADYYLEMGQCEAAETELTLLDGQDLTPVMAAAKLLAKSRIAVMRDQWAEAEEIANRAYTAALEVNYTPLRVDALGVLVAVAARKNRREEQLRLVIEMASLAQAK